MMSISVQFFIEEVSCKELLVVAGQMKTAPLAFLLFQEHLTKGAEEHVREILPCYS